MRRPQRAVASLNAALKSRSRIAVLAVALGCAFATGAAIEIFVPAPTVAATAAGTTISNSASATYSDGSGGNFSVNSNTITVVAQNVPVASVANIHRGSDDRPVSNRHRRIPVRQRLQQRRQVPAMVE